MSVRNYIQNARNNANERYMSWTGNPAPINGGYRNMVGNSVNAAGSIVDPRQRLAAGQGGGNNAPQSQPYIITISNASATGVSNFDV